MSTIDYELSDRLTREDGTVFCTGVQALARLPVEQLRADRRAGHHTAVFASGYPGSPLAGLDQELQRAAALAPDLPIVLRPALNEELGVSAVMGSQLAAIRPDARYQGVVGLWYGKAPGLDRASDALRHAVFTGTSPLGGAVAIVGDDPAAKSSTLPSSSDATLIDLHLPILYPADVTEALDLGRHAIALSRASGLWVGLKIVGAVADGTATVELDPDRVRPVVPSLGGEPYTCRPDGLLLGAHSLEIERELRGPRHEMAIAYGTANDLNRVVVDPPSPWLGVVASGLTFRELMEAFGRLGLDASGLAAAGIRVLQMKMPIPFDPAVVRSFAAGLEEVMVVEEMNPSLERRMRDALYGVAGRPLVTGRLDRDGGPLMPGHGPLVADRMLEPLRRALSDRLGHRIAPLPPPPRERMLIAIHDARTPAFCSGCPHNRSTRVPEGSLVGAGIGCHTMAMLGDDERLGEIVCITAMGNEGAPWIGMADFVETTHFVQNLGDGTYFHSGQLAVQAAVDAGVAITFKLLHNGHVAMTGGQRPPGQRDLGDVCRVLLAQGVRRVIVTTDDVRRHPRRALPRGVEVWDRSRVLEAQEVLAATGGVTVMIHDQPCAAEVRRFRHRHPGTPAPARVLINERVCEGCGDCAERSSCLSVQPVDTPFGRKTRIDQASCNLDQSCLDGDCPSFLTVAPASGRWRLPAAAVSWARGRDGRSAATAAGRSDPPVPPADLPDPEPVAGPRELSGPATVRMAGIGGTGVVTAAQVLAIAAMLDGLVVRGLDQTGLSQKAGPVVSDLVLCPPGGAPVGNRVGEGQADVMLALDALVAAADGPLGAASPDRTRLVGSSSTTPTATMVLHPHRSADPPATVRRRVESACVPGALWADAAAIATRLAGTPAAANLVVLGMAVQSGLLPVTPSSMHRAIGLNGVSVAANRAAFDWGRAVVADPAAVTGLLPAAGDLPRADSGAEGAGLPIALQRRLVELAGCGAGDAVLEAVGLHVADLVAFGDEVLASGYLDLVAAAAAREQQVRPGSWELTAAVSRQLHRVLAYKDEYEVARLLVDPDVLAEARSLVDGPARVKWRLHPPLLRSLGLRHKVGVGPWAAPAMRALARGKQLRGTPWDPFGRTAVRRAERGLADSYRAALQEVVAGLTPARHPMAVVIAELPDGVRGYEQRKLDGIARFHRSLDGALAGYRGVDAPAPGLGSPAASGVEM